MNIQVGYQLKQQQQIKLTITPEMRQSLKILQLSAVELASYTQEQIIENPMLEAEEITPAKIDQLEISNIPSSEHKISTLDGDTVKPAWEYPASRKSLAHHVEEQLIFLNLSNIEKEICLALIGNLNEQGYLDLDVPLFCRQFRISEQLFENCLSIIQSLDPIGIGSRSLAEYLDIQLRHQKHLHPFAREIAQRFLPELAKNKWKLIAAELGATLSEIQQAVDIIKQCNPRPNTFFSTAPTPYIYPDVTIDHFEDNFQIYVNKAVTPKIHISNTYFRLMNQDVEQEVEQYLKNQYQTALWFIKGVEQREQTISQIAKVILWKQKDFFERGISHLKPLTLKQVSEEIDLHESTVSRATQNKYMQTPQGIFPFRFFFQTGLSEEMASHTVKNRLQQLIAHETKTSPFSDQKLTELLQQEGIAISRRTVTKYREKLGIASSASRKRYAVQ